jgi:hypothetical protein
VLILDGERFDDITCALEWNGGPLAFGFLSGSVEILRKARTARNFELQLRDGTKLPATMLQVSNAGMALLSINPKHLSQSRDKLHDEGP